MSREPDPIARVAVCTQDLMSWSRLAGTVRAAGLEPVQVQSPTRLIQAHDDRRVTAAIIDLQSPAGGIEAVRAAANLQPPILIIAIGPHVDAPLLDAARQAGAQHALPHSATGEKLAKLLATAPAPA